MTRNHASRGSQIIIIIIIIIFVYSRVQIIICNTNIIEIFQGPVRLCQKRADKLMDYTAALQRLRQNKDVSKKIMVSRNKLEAKYLQSFLLNI